jgi:predicted nucleic acid-binding protein
VNYLLDTNVVSEIRKGERSNPGVIRWLSGVNEADLYISVLVAGEIRQGIERLKPRDPDQANIFERWLADLRRYYGERILEVSLEDAELWGRINAPDPLPAVDSLIAAQARLRGMIVVSGNIPDFDRTGIEVLNPFD